MTLAEIKTAVDLGETVYWSSPVYKVVKDSLGQYSIKCTLNEHYIGLTHQDGITLNGREEEFYIHKTN